MAATGPNNPRNKGHYKIKTPEELQLKIDSYFKSCDTHKRKELVGTGANAKIRNIPDPQPYTWTGLARAVGLEGRGSLLLYQEREEFVDVIRDARLRIQEQWEGKLMRLGNNNGVMFALMNSSTESNTWQQKVTQDLNMGGQPGNPVEVKGSVDITVMSEEKLEKVLKLLEGDD